MTRQRKPRWTAVAGLLSSAVLVSGCSAVGMPTSGAPSATTVAAPSLSPVHTPVARARPWCLRAGERRHVVGFGRGLGSRWVAVLGRGPRGVVIGSQANGDVCQAIGLARAAAARGYRVAVFDWGRHYTASLASAVQVLRDAGASRIAVGGFSRGAVVALGAAPGLGADVTGVFSVSGGPSASEGYPSVASVSRYPGPLLLVAARQDPVFPHSTVHRIAARHDGEEQILLVPGDEHALALLDGEHGPVVRRALFTFLAGVTAP